MPAEVKDGAFEIVTPGNDLEALSRAIVLENEAARHHFEAAKDAALPHVLRIGLHCLSAREIFAMDPEARARAGGLAKASSSRRDELSDPALSRRDKADTPASFSDWLATIQGLQKGAAYKYLTAVKGLGLDHASDPEEVMPALEKLRAERAKKSLPKPTIALLVSMGREQQEEKPGPEPKRKLTPEERAGEARTCIHEFQEEWSEFLRTGDLDFLPAEDLRPLETFLADELGRVRKLLKSAS